MSIKIIKMNENEFKFIEDDKEIILSREKDIKLEKKTGHFWLLLPDNSLNRKLINLNKFSNSNEVVIDKFKNSISVEKKEKMNIQDFISEDEKKIIEEIMNKAKDRMNKFLEDKKLLESNPRFKELMKMKKDLENLKNLGMEIPEENFKRINEEIEKLKG